MDKRVLIAIIVVIVLALCGGGAFLFFQSQQQAVVPVSTPAPVVKQQTAQPTLSVQGPTSLVASQSATLDIYVDTKGVKVDGFQFIATLEGTATPVVQDADPNATGVQISAEVIPELTIATNSVVDQSGKQVIRFAMITAAGTSGYATSTPVKVASIPVIPGAEGTAMISFNPQNSRASKSTGGEDALFTTSDKTFTVAATSTSDPLALAPTTTASTSSTIASAPTTTTNTSTQNPSCRLSCATDNDCAAGLACEFGLCVNPACSSSQTCSCTTPNLTAQTAPTPYVPPTASSSTSALIAQGTSNSTSSATTTTTTSALVTPTPKATVKASTMSATLTQSDPLPVSGSIENTLLLLGAGFLFIGLGFVFAR